MVNVEVVNIALWAPFALIMLIIGIIFCINGYRKGLWRALLSLLATVISAVVSVFVSPMIAKKAVDSASGVFAEVGITGEIEQLSPEFAEMVDELVNGVLQSVVALSIFGLIFLF